MSFIKLTTLGEDKNIAKLKKIPPVARQVALENLSDYLINFGGGNSLRWYPPQRAQSSYIRTNRLKNAWTHETTGTRAYLTNNTPYAPYPIGNPPTDRMRLRGWRGAMERVMANLSKGVAYARAKVMAAIGNL